MKECLICGEKKVLPQYEVDVEVFVHYDFGIPICQDCYESEDNDVQNNINKIITESKKQFPF